jgi:DNA processing protein
MIAAELRDWLRLARTENVGPVTFNQLISRYGDAAKALAAIPELAAQGGLKRKLSMPSPASIEDELHKVAKLGARVITKLDEDYPRLLKHLSDAPPALTMHGHTNILSKPTVAIVGARNASINGRRFAEKLGRDLGEADYTVISGLAAGIDASAHQGALPYGTVGVVAGGIDQIYPPENEKLHQQMTQTGLVVAEMPLGTPINAKLFPRRNRIVSGLSLGVVVIEAAIQSGSLITARLAGEQGREVMAVPGSPLDPRSSGTNKLIKDGATLIESAADVLAALQPGGMHEPEQNIFNQQAIENADEKLVAALRPQVLAALSPTPTPIDDIIRVCQTPPSAVLAVLLELELAGRLVRMPGNQVALLLDLAGAVNE